MKAGIWLGREAGVRMAKAVMGGEGGDDGDGSGGSGVGGGGDNLSISIEVLSGTSVHAFGSAHAVAFKAPRFVAPPEKGDVWGTRTFVRVPTRRYTLQQCEHYADCIPPSYEVVYYGVNV